MPKKTYKPDEIVSKLRQADVLIAMAYPDFWVSANDLQGLGSIDALWPAPNTLIADATSEDRASLFGLSLTVGFELTPAGRDVDWVRQTFFPWVRYGLAQNSVIAMPDARATAVSELTAN